MEEYGSYVRKIWKGSVAKLRVHCMRKYLKVSIIYSHSLHSIMDIKKNAIQIFDKRGRETLEAIKY